jgi:hypothetical protein
MSDKWNFDYFYYGYYCVFMEAPNIVSVCCNCILTYQYLHFTSCKWLLTSFVLLDIVGVMWEKWKDFVAFLELWPFHFMSLLWWDVVFFQMWFAVQIRLASSLDWHSLFVEPLYRKEDTLMVLDLPFTASQNCLSNMWKCLVYWLSFQPFRRNAIRTLCLNYPFVPLRSPCWNTCLEFKY